MRENYSRACAENGKFPSCKPPVLHLLKLFTPVHHLVRDAPSSSRICAAQSLPHKVSSKCSFRNRALCDVLCLTFCFLQATRRLQDRFCVVTMFVESFRRGSLRALPNRSRSVDPAHLHRASQERSGEYL